MFVLGNAERNLLSKKEKTNKYYIEDYDIDLKNKNNSHAIVVSYAKDFENILDVGCGAGFIGKKIKENHDATIAGIEIDEKARKIAAESYDIVYSFSIENYENEEYKKFLAAKDEYDCIILADVVEHLVDPGKLIFTLSKKLKKNGVIIVSTPNIAHIDVIRNLINGRFNYNTTGILDSTHTKFFTEQSFYDFVENLNEKYGLKYGVKTIGKTYAKSDDKDDVFIFSLVGKELYRFQNIFLISEGITTKAPKYKDNYKLINKKYLKLGKQLEKAQKDNLILKNALEEKTAVALARELDVDNLKKDVEAITGSVSWRITKPLRIVAAIFGRGRKNDA